MRMGDRICCRDGRRQPLKELNVSRDRSAQNFDGYSIVADEIAGVVFVPTTTPNALGN